MKKILVVDDDSAIRSLLRLYLMALGYDVFEAANGQEAMDASLDSSFELVLTDIVMPDIEGIELIAHMQKGDPDLPIIVMTGHDRYTPIIDALQVNEILFKPFSMEEVSYAVKKIFS